MEKKINASDKPLLTRVIYGVVIAILCITAIVVGIVAAANKRNDAPDDTPIIDGGGDETKPDEKPDDTVTEPEKKELTFVSPVKTGKIGTAHSDDTPVFSDTLDEWRLHTGIDIYTDEDAPVYAAESGTVTAIYKDPLLGNTVEITHDEEHKTLYSNLKDESVVIIQVGDTVEVGDRIGTVGDTAIKEVADEAHLHFEMLVSGKSVNPLDHLSEEVKVSLGIET